MRKSRMAVLGAIVAVVVAGLVPATAAAEPNLRAFRGDVNGDRIADRVTPGVEPGGPGKTPCVFGIELGKPDGTLGASRDYTFDSPRTSAPYCPDMGVVGDLRRDGKPDLITTGFQWSEGGLLTLRLVRDKLKVTGLQPGLPFPNTLRSADFNADGYPDVWSSSKQVREIRSYNSTSDGSFVPGPISGCSSDPVPQHVIADFDGDGGDDILMSRRCEFLYWVPEIQFGSGKAPVAFAGGFQAYQVFSIDIEDDGHPDVGVISDTPQLRVQYFRNDGAGNFTWG
ncbi:FG-GAP-like repeat-containing protein [Actinokineospora diospyrosa]|uniref:Repeat domain-containing protein n=1 Tax=Actinokineospora diospyrosa TaxID=103728 RepID=A0ABT1IIV4_9PSEU|nr:FG-GAP-like repeat-containing protein [Actinokineospora diospyrosa]MCP2272592.1 Repeat domain-containing protein [Actinokineospora diospyrosa]